MHTAQPTYGAPPPGSGPVDYPGFARVIDGDSLELYIKGRQTAVGVIGIKAPKGRAACAPESASLVQQLVKGGLWLKEEPTYSYDAKKRRMYYVQLRDGRSLAKELVKNGLSAPDGTGNETSDLTNLGNTAAAAATGCLNAGKNPGGRGPGPNAFVPAPTPAKSRRGDGSRLSLSAALEPRAGTTTGGFTEQVVVAGLTSPTAFTFLPDGRIIIAQKNGVIRVFKNGVLLPTPLLDISSEVNSYWDHGMIGMAADANFATNGFVYVAYTFENDATAVDGTKTARISRFTVSGDAASPASELVLLGKQVGSSCANFPAGADCLPSESQSHSIGNIKVDPSGNLFVMAGDGAYFNLVDDQALRSQDLTSLGGKLLHITPTGLGLSTNPFYDGNTGSNRSKVWALGLRNPFRFTLRPGSGVPFIGDVGWDTWEEVNVSSAGTNFGWPCYEGNFQQPGYSPKAVCQTLYGQGTAAVRAPLWVWNHNGLSSASVGGAFYTGTSFPAQYQGAYFFADYAESMIRYLQVDAANNLTAGPFDFTFNADGPVDLEMGPDQNLYYLSIVAGEVRRVVFTGPDTTPPTVIGTNPAAGVTGVAANPTVAVLFSEGMQSGTVTTAAVTLTVQATGAPVSATVSYNGSSNSATLTPSTTLSPSTVYTITVKGGSGGVKDLAGNPMSIDFTSTFTTTAIAPPPSGTSFVSDLAWTFMTNGWGPIEKDLSNGEQFAGDGHAISIRGVKFTKGLGAHAASELRYYLGGVCTSMTTSVGVDDEEAGNGSVDFQILADGTLLYDSGVVTGTMAAKSATVNLCGKHELRLLVGDGGDGINNDHADWAGATITCSTGNAPPTATIATPGSALTYKVGDTITFSGSGKDPIDGNIPPAALSWQIILHHCPGGICHTHFFLTATGVASGTFTAPDHGDSSFFEIDLTVTNSKGLTGTASVTIQPQTLQLTLATSPAGLQVVYGGTAATAPVTFTTIVGSTHTIFAPSPQTNLTFSSWSDNGAAQHNVTVGATNVTYTATFASSGPPSGTSYVSDLTWTSMSNGWGPVELNTSNGEQLAGDGHVLSIRGVTYAKGLGAHAPSDIQYNIARSCTAFTAVVAIDDEVAPSGTVIFRVLGDGATLYDSGVVSGSTAALNVNVNITGKSVLELVVADDGDGLSFDHADWANAQITCGGAAQPPAVSSVTPSAGATGIAVNTAVTAIFSAAMTASTITTSTVTLVQQGTTTPLAATVSYNSSNQAVTLQPTAKLALGITYTATVKGGTSGVKDANGTAMVADKTWNFTIMPRGTTFLSALPLALAVNGWGPVELDKSNGEQAAGDGKVMSIRTTTFAKGLGVHAPSDVRFNIGGACSNFSATIGIDDEAAPNGSVVFQVFGDGTKIFDSGLKTGTGAAQNASVNISGKNVLQLVVTDSGNGNALDHSDWANARITCP